jgi:hypothetical protein
MVITYFYFKKWYGVFYLDTNKWERNNIKNGVWGVLFGTPTNEI